MYYRKFKKRETSRMLIMAATLLPTVATLSSCSDVIMSAFNSNEIQFDVTERPFVADSGAAQTRATMVTSLSQMKVYAYDASGNAVINGVTYTNNNGTWTAPTSAAWPSGNVTFYAFSPANNSAVNFNTSTKQITYTAPSAQGSQQDVCYAYTVTSRPANGTVDLTFNHDNAAFSVNGRLASGCTAVVNVSGVQIVNVKPTNTLTLSNGNTTADGTNISSTLACSAKTLTTSNQAISTEPLILPPQTVTAWGGTSALADTYLAVTCKMSQDDKYFVGSATTNGTVYVPMSKALNRGENNSVNLVFGTEEGNARCYGRDANGNRITVSESSGDNPLSFITSADVGKILYSDGQNVHLADNIKSLPTATGATIYIWFNRLCKQSRTWTNNAI